MKSGFSRYFKKLIKRLTLDDLNLIYYFYYKWAMPVFSFVKAVEDKEI